MKSGKNTLKNSSLEVYLEQFKENWFKITPLNFDATKPLKEHELYLSYTISNKSKESVSEAGITAYLAQENDSIALGREDQTEGDITVVRMDLGLISVVDAKPEKYLFLQEGLDECRNRPFNEIVAEEVSKRIITECEKQACKHYSYGKRLDQVWSMTLCRPHQSWCCN